MTVPLLEHLPWARQRIAGAPHLLVLKLGNPSGTCAPFSLEGPHAVQYFLLWLAELVF